MKITDNRTVNGAITGRYDPKPEETAKADLGFCLEITLHPGAPPENIPPTRLHLWTYVSGASNPTWTDILASFQTTTAEMKAARLYRMLSRGSFFNSLSLAYRGILWRDFSIDLVAAALRQREFSKKIISPELREIDTPSALSRATIRYHKFLLLNRRKEKMERKVGLVPTLDIDLCWHTHQLFAVQYRSWCIEHLGTAINHDDTIAKEDLDKGLHETNQAWSKTYREDYTKTSGLQTKSRLAGLFSRRKSKVVESTCFISGIDFRWW